MKRRQGPLGLAPMEKFSIRRSALTLLAILVAVAIPAGIAMAGKSKPLKHKGKVGISAKVEPGEKFVPKHGGSPIKLTFERKGKRVTKLKKVDFDEIHFLCKRGPGIIAKGVRVGGAKVSKAKKHKPAKFRYFEKGGGDEAFFSLGASGAKKFSFEFTGSLLDRKGKRATGKLRVEFVDRSQGSCSTGAQVWRSEKR